MVIAKYELNGTLVEASNMNTEDGLRSPRGTQINIVDMMERYQENEEDAKVPTFLNDLVIGETDLKRE